MVYTKVTTINLLKNESGVGSSVQNLQTVLNASVAKKPKLLNAVTGVRFFASLLVVFIHSYGPFKLSSRDLLAEFGLAQIVTLFFVISGFIITYNYSGLQTFAQFKKFFSRRLTRIWPTHVAVFVLYMVLGLGVNFSNFEKPQTFAFLLMLHSLIPLQSYFYYTNAPSWSVSVEVVFYLMFPLFLASSRYLKVGPLIMSGAFLIASMGAAYFCLQTHLPSEFQNGLLYISPFARCVEFAIGMVTARIFMRHMDRHDHQQNEIASFVLEIICVALTIGCVLFWPRILASCHLPASLDVPRAYLDESGGAIVFAALVYVLAAERSLISKWLATKPMVWLGEISFAIYMTHVMVIIVFMKNGWQHCGVPRLQLYELYLLAVLAVSALMHHLVERPAKTWLDGLGKRKVA